MATKKVSIAPNKKPTPKKDTKATPKKRTRKTSLTPRQKRVVDKVVENGGKTKGEILKGAGYSDAIAKNPDKVFESKGIRQAFVDAGITDEYLTKKNLQLLEAHEIAKMPFPKDTPVEKIKKSLEESVPGAKYISYSDEEGKKPGTMIRWARFSVPDRLTQDKALEKAYKVAGSYAPEKHKVEGEFSLLSLFKPKPKE